MDGSNGRRPRWCRTRPSCSFQRILACPVSPPMPKGVSGMSTPNLGLVAFPLTFGLLAIGVSHAQEAFPSRAVRIVVPYPAGGGTDIIGRFVAEQLSRKWRQSVTIENVGGGAGNIGAAVVARAV